jgi:DNA ligase-1
MEYLELVEVYEKLEATSKRLEKTKLISEFLLRIKEKDLSSVILLLQGKLFASWDETKLGIASRLVIKSISKATGISTEAVETEWKKTGDLGLAAQNIVSKKSQITLFSQSLTVDKVFTNMQKLAGMEGKGAVDRKIQLISELLTSSKPKEARYIIRTLLEDMRVGVGEGVLRDAIVWAYFGKTLNLSYKKEEDELVIADREEYNKYVEAVQQAYDITNDFAVVADIAKKHGINGLLGQELKVGRPVKVMLALKVNDAKEGLERVGTPAEVEFKLDGFRMQVHKSKNEIKLFTRRLEDVTKQFPDVVSFVKENIKADSCILDSEAVGYSTKTGKYLPFQNISQRIKRKYDIDEIAKKFPVELNVFDILLYEGKNLIKEPFKKRREIIEKIVKQKEKQIVLVKKIVTDKEKEINDFFKKSVTSGNEGLMLKNLASPYKPGARVGYMVKLKETMENLDLVIIGAEWGEGKRANWLSSYILACQDEDGNLLEIGRVSTGLKEKREEGLSFDEMTETLKPLIISEKGKEAKIKPQIVIEVAYEEIQKSPTYGSGYALRFPRVVRLRTDERDVSDISTLEYVDELYYGQKKK